MTTETLKQANELQKSIDDLSRKIEQISREDADLIDIERAVLAISREALEELEALLISEYKPKLQFIIEQLKAKLEAL